MKNDYYSMAMIHPFQYKELNKKKRCQQKITKYVHHYGIVI